MNYDERGARVVLLSQLFASLADKLTEYSWKRQRVWQDRAAVFEFEHSPGCRIAFDVFLESEGIIRMHVVARDPLHGESMAHVLKDSGAEIREAKGKGARYEVILNLVLTSREEVGGVSSAVGRQIAKIRDLMAQWSGSPVQWNASNGVSVNYVDRAPRSGSSQLVVVFSSIRSKRYWLDFGGPHGESLRGVRGRVLLILDDVGREYCYNLRRRGEADVEAATLEFLRFYIEKYEVSTRDIVLCGMSKGGTAAICLGSRLPGVRVLASVPQMQLGTYLAQRGDGIFKHMYGVDPNVQTVAEADDFVPARLRELIARGDRAVVLTSEADSNCFDVLVDGIARWGGGDSLDLVVVSSSSVVDHTSTLRFVTPAFLGWLSLFCVAMPPVELGRLVPVRD